MKIKYILPAILMILSPFIYSQNQEDLYQKEIKTISFVGLKRTKIKKVNQIIAPIQVGSIYTEKTNLDIIQSLRETGIFNPDIQVKAYLVEDKIDLIVEVKDKWSLIPIPIFSFGTDGDWQVGILGIETNLLGSYKTLGLGVFFGSEGWSILNFYQDPLFLGTKWQISYGLSLGLREESDELSDETIYREYKTQRASLSFDQDYEVIEHLTLGLNQNYYKSMIQEQSAGSNLNDLNLLGVGFKIDWEDFFFDIPYKKGIKTKFVAQNYWSLDEGQNITKGTANITWNLPLWIGHMFSTEFQAGGGQLPPQLEYRLGGTSISRILPMNRISADNYIGVSGSYNAPLWFFPGGTLSGKVFYEVGNFNSDTVESTFYQGPGFGLDIFIDNLGIPALQFNFGWNLETNLMQFSAGVGMQVN